MTANLYDLKFEELRELLQDLNQPTFRAKQIWQGIYQNLWTDLTDFSNLPLILRDQFSSQFNLGGLTLEKELSSTDGQTHKYLYRLEDGSAIETVLMAYHDRNTVCISSQVGCAMGCKFCATGNMGFVRNLTSGEIVEQVIKSAAILSSNDNRLTNVVFMGMGEPFHNYQAVREAIVILNDPNGFGMGKRRFTISTVGIVPGIKKLTEERSQVNLAISLHAADDQLRSNIVPINSKYNISALMTACDAYLEKNGRRITIEWALIDGVNDTDEQARKLVNLIKGKLFHVNLIQLNPVDHYPGKPAMDQNARRFQKIIEAAGIPCTIRLRRGIDIQAGCGQLASNTN
ncbi:MAG: 23S rRNA (adenine(2503)-C(2))-methyltransferase RlmN [Chloroflexota bacterium]|nr:MAG: 23S rRNA (adenine(2503)-C(2))-methyltransferase RlmN [Chloroflexota bacterium]